MKWYLYNKTKNNIIEWGYGKYTTSHLMAQDALKWITWERTRPKYKVGTLKNVDREDVIEILSVNE